MAKTGIFDDLMLEKLKCETCVYIYFTRLAKYTGVLHQVCSDIHDHLDQSFVYAVQMSFNVLNSLF